MPWKKSTPMDQKIAFIHDWLSDQYYFSDLCSNYGISRKTGYKLVDKYKKNGFDGLVDLRRTPHSHPATTPEHIRESIISIRKKHKLWGARKIAVLLENEYTKNEIPSAVTINKILQQAGLINQKKRRRRVTPLFPIFDPEKSNDIWSADYKGKFRMGNNVYCHPLTIADSYSRFLFTAKGHYHERFKTAKATFKRVFQEYGLPRQIHTDNGHPFGNVASIGRYTRLSYWFIELGIQPVFSDPGSPQQNGRHERMHKDLKAACAKPPLFDLRVQQRRLNAFVKEYNTIRPHESLEMKTPASVHEISTRRFPSRIKAWEYNTDLLVKRVTKNGSMRWGAYEWLKVSSALADKWVGLEQMGGGSWRVYYRDVILGYFNETDTVVPGKYHKLHNDRV